MTISPDALIVLIGAVTAVQVTRAALTYRAAQRAADRKAAKETGNG